MKIFIFSIINYIAGFHLLPEFTDVEEINTLKTYWKDKSGRSIPRMDHPGIPDRDGPWTQKGRTFRQHLHYSYMTVYFQIDWNNNILIALSELN